MSRDNKDLVVGLDIGTSKIVALVAEINQEGRLNVIGMGSQDSRGLKKGVVVNIESTVTSIQRAVEEAEGVFVGGGNSFRLLDALQRSGVLPVAQT